MRPILLVCLLAAVMVCGCTGGIDGDTAVPTVETIPTVEPLPTAPALPTAEPLPTAPGLPAADISPVPRSAGDPVIGTWHWPGENNTGVVYSFEPDGTFQRRDEGAGMDVYTGTWASEGGGSYRLVYDHPGFVPEHITYYPDAGRLVNRSSYFSRV